jgi:hypothetical protein
MMPAWQSRDPVKMPASFLTGCTRESLCS